MSNKAMAEVKDNVVEFSVKPGGKSPNNNWLKELKDGTKFLTRQRNPKNPVPFLIEFSVTTNQGDVCLLFQDTNEEAYIWVSTETFSLNFELIKITLYIEENEDGTSD